MVGKLFLQHCSSLYKPTWIDNGIHDDQMWTFWGGTSLKDGSQERFINLTQMDAQIYPTQRWCVLLHHWKQYQDRIQSGRSLVSKWPTRLSTGGCTLIRARYGNHSLQRRAMIPHSILRTLSWWRIRSWPRHSRIPTGQNFIDDRVCWSTYPSRWCSLMFTDDNGDFLGTHSRTFDSNGSHFEHRWWTRSAIINVDTTHTHTPDGMDTIFAIVVPMSNDTLLTYKTWGWISSASLPSPPPLAEWFPDASIESDPVRKRAGGRCCSDDPDAPLIMIRANQGGSVSRSRE